MSKKISIDPITRLEGHGKIDIFLNDDGDVEKAFLQVPELRGFEKFVEGRPAEEMPQITSRICGVCPGAHHMAGTKALDALFKVVPTDAAKAIREMYYVLHTFEDHILHFYILGGPDFIVGPDAPEGERNVLGVINKVGVEAGKKIIGIRKKARKFIEEIAGKVIHPVFGLPGGVSKKMTEETRQELKAFSLEAIDFALFSLQTFNDLVLSKKEYTELIESDIYYHKTNYMGMVDSNDFVNFYDGKVKVIDPDGKEIDRFTPEQYTDVIGEQVEPWSYIKFPYLKKIGWKGFVEGSKSGIYRVAPLARLNVAKGMATPKANEEYEKMFDALGGKPAHNTLATHWARLVEILYCAERIGELAEKEEFSSPDIRNMDLKEPSEGIGIVEAPRGTIIHHYQSNKNGIITGCNLIVASLGNSAAMCMSVEKAAKKLIKKGKVTPGLLNMVEMAFRAYDPCLGCATHSLPGKMPLVVSLKNLSGKKIGQCTRDFNGKETFF